MSKSKTYSKGNLPYELNIQNGSTITTLGEYEALNNSRAKSIEFKEVPLKRGFVSKYM